MYTSTQKGLLKTLLLLCAFSWLAKSAIYSQSLYIKTFGNQKDKPIIFLHGGPGYNCASFEATTAQPLAAQGFFVIVYDRRGEGRSKDPNAAYTFNETFADLNAIYTQYHLGKATLIGHSFGGMVATLFAQRHPDKVQSIFLVGAPVSLQASFRNIITRSKSIYQTKNDSVNLRYLAMLEKMDTASLEYSSFCFRHAMQNGFYTPKNLSAEARSLYTAFRSDTTLMKYAGKMSIDAPTGFWKNEQYTILDLSNDIRSLIEQKVPVYGMYGKEDGLYSTAQVSELESMTGAGNMQYLDNCSHSVFVDQQNTFIAFMKSHVH